VIEVLTMWERQTGRKVLCIRSDQGTEFQGEFAVWCKRNGVRRQYSAVYKPQQNGRAERMNRTVLEMARALLMQRECAVKYWPLAMQAVAYVRNRVPAGEKPYRNLYKGS
jgi:transposase InsO family protein